MNRYTFCTRILVLYLLALLEVSPSRSDDAAQPLTTSSVTAATEFQKLVDEWNSAQAELAKEQIKLYSGDQNAAVSIKPRFVELLAKLDALQPRLRDAAEK